MINLVFPYPAAAAGRLVLAALRRSVSECQVRPIALGRLTDAGTDLLVMVSPTPEMGLRLIDALKAGRRKVILLGQLPDCLIDHLGFERLGGWPEHFDVASRSAPAATYASSESLATVRYTGACPIIDTSGWSRPFERFDFTDEWNNLGFGAIRGADPCWGVAAPLKANPAQEIARLDVAGEDAGSYCALFDTDAASVLWINREVGTIDSFEWRLLERFLSSYRPDALPCQPVLLEVPWGYDAAITMRLDCDEDVESARALWNAYQKMGVPFSLAVHTTNLADERHHAILREMVAAGQSVLSHTATHAPNWGGSYQAACGEAETSSAALTAVTGMPVLYAVSPFHQSPPYALAALSDAGYRGCIGGIIRNDPEFLIARGGALDGLPNGFIGHSQQCMLHGDCMLEGDDPLKIFKAAFDLAYSTGMLFGFLDHPFSPRYQYGWHDEPSRTSAHVELIDHIRRVARRPLFLSAGDAMDFLSAKSLWRVVDDRGPFRFIAPAGEAGRGHVPTVEWAGQRFSAQDGRVPA